ncbi:SDR family NAD(P)-dependent oxidoreductase [Croceicoccus mobilis]|uniref:Short-chain dehydrogenase/reductase n=1 Tax=Croceicoccus mobilis TaxID=1703339 RepID=A0A916Z7Q3_9SPHN|nr:SDR family oxidoreductase [Croceicoccus mobilis]GGD80623.1 putative short-chain dehydrogenase/reductase [Croceicoccus mobilis]
MRRTNSNDLSGKTAIVTGGARGLGEGIAWALAENGARVMITDVLDAEGEALAAAMGGAGHKAVFRHHDVRDAAAWQEIVAATLAEFGGLDILVNNAGINFVETIESATEEQFRNIVEVNLIGPFIGMQAVIPHMKDAGGGSIVNLSSNSTRKVVVSTTVYSATKAALANLTKTSAAWLGQYGIRVNSVHPGAHDTEMVRKGFEQVTDPAIREAILNAIPLGRLGRPEETGALVAFLASDAASYISGGEYFIDGANSNI